MRIKQLNIKNIFLTTKSVWLLLYSYTPYDSLITDVSLDFIYKHKPSIKDLKQTFKKLDIVLTNEEIEQLYNEGFVISDDNQYTLIERTSIPYGDN